MIGHRRSAVRTPMPEFFGVTLKFWSRKWAKKHFRQEISENQATFLDFGHFFTHIENSKTENFVTNTYADFRHQGVRLITKINPAMRKENFRDEKQSTSERKDRS